MLADDSLHAMGNGRLLIYGKGPHIEHAFGPLSSLGAGAPFTPAENDFQLLPRRQGARSPP